ncbi:hypothetical protein NQ318_022268, partial [Aromia moschata]
TMAETTEFVSTIRVKDLISAFESKSESVRVEFTRPRARSVGNILAKNVIVRQNEFNSLDDVQKALKKLDASLNFYEVYNKEKHVAYQEELFNILTSIVNIEGTEEDSTRDENSGSENTASLESEEEPRVSVKEIRKLYSNPSIGINLHTTQYKPSEATDNSFTSATIGSDDFYKQESLIEQELDKIKVEPMLADEEIVLNPEDLQNADNEFEKLLEGTESTNIVT